MLKKAHSIVGDMSTKECAFSFAYKGLSISGSNKIKIIPFNKNELLHKNKPIVTKP